MVDEKNNSDLNKGFSATEKIILGVFLAIGGAANLLLPNGNTEISLFTHIKNFLSDEAKELLEKSGIVQTADIVLEQVKKGEINSEGLKALNELIKIGKEVKIGDSKGKIIYTAKEEASTGSHTAAIKEKRNAAKAEGHSGHKGH